MKNVETIQHASGERHLLFERGSFLPKPGRQADGPIRGWKCLPDFASTIFLLVFMVNSILRNLDFLFNKTLYPKNLEHT